MIKKFSSYNESLRILKRSARRRHAGKEIGDCTIRATCLAFDLNYSEVKEYFEEINDPKIGYTDEEMLSIWRRMGLKYRSVPVNYDLKIDEFIKSHQEGNFVISYSNHVTNLIDGKIYDIDKSVFYFKKEPIHRIYKPV